MKKFDAVMHYIDDHVEKRVVPLWSFVQKHFTVFSVTFLLILFGVFVTRLWTDRSQVLAATISDDLVAIETVLNQIDKECNILSIRVDRGYIDFFTVEKFVGSSVGALNLAYPQKWKGPYLSVNPTIEEIPYEIVHAKDGYFVVPGYGVQLPNKVVIGRDVKINEKVAVLPLLASGGKLHYKGQVFAVKLTFIVGDWDSPHFGKSTLEKTQDMLTEFNEAMTYAQSPATANDAQVC